MSAVLPPIVIVLLDGVADRAHSALGGRTANEVARTPILDELCRRGAVGVHHAIGPGRAPSSELAHWALLGYRPEEFVGRAVLEARGHGIEPRRDAVHAYGALRASVVRDGCRWLTGRARRDDDVANRQLLARLDGLDANVHVHPLPRGEAIVSFVGLPSDAVSDSDSMHEHRFPMLRPVARTATFESVAAAARVERWSRRALAALAPEPTDAFTLKWFGRAEPVPSFRSRHGLDGPVVGASPFLAGLAATVGLAPVRDPDSDDPGADLRRRIARLGEALDAGASFAFCHTKAPDEAGHTKDPTVKAALIESLDVSLAALLDGPFAQAIVCVTGDHGTPASGPDVIHSGDAVPLTVVGPSVRPDEVAVFGESAAVRGSLGRLAGCDLMPILLDLAGRAAFLGARVGPDPYPSGLPIDPEPFR